MKEDLLKRLLESVLGKSKSARGGEEAVLPVLLATTIRKN